MCTTPEARRLLKAGAQLCAHLDEYSTKANPVWRLSLLDAQGQHWVLASTIKDRPRKLSSIQQVYQVARTLSIERITIPVDLLTS